jgi:hypothetical protein
MADTTKTFDCIEMKREAQERLMAEHEKRKHEFVGFGDFLKKKAEESSWQRSMLEKFGKDKRKESA